MKQSTKQKAYKASLITRYHTICTKLGWTKGDRLEFLLNNYGVESSKDLTIDELKHICDALDEKPIVRNVDIEKQIADEKRQKACNRVFGAVGGWLDMLYGEADRTDPKIKKERERYIMGIACRQTGYTDFNKIPTARLVNVSFFFTNMQKDYKAGKVSVDSELARMAFLN